MTCLLQTLKHTNLERYFILNIDAFSWNRFEPSSCRDVLAPICVRLIIFVYLRTSGGHQVWNTVSSVWKAFPVNVCPIRVQFIRVSRTLCFQLNGAMNNELKE